MEHTTKFHFVHPDVNLACPSTLEAVNNHFVANTDIQLVHAADTTIEVKYGWNQLNAKLREMMARQTLYDVDVRDLYVMIDQLGMRNQWCEMNDKIRADLEEISLKVEASKKMLDENPPEMKAWGQRFHGFHHYGYPMMFPLMAKAVAEQEPEPEPIVEPEPVVEPEPTPEPEPVEEEKMTFYRLSRLPWARWGHFWNHDVANANVSEVIPMHSRYLQFERKMSDGSWNEQWNKLMEDVMQWHKWGVHRFNIRVCNKHE